MSLTLTDICNKALAALGEGRIGDYSEVSPLGTIVRTHYELERDTLLQSHLWKFARKRQTLTALDDAPAFGWTFAYGLPDDCLRVWSVNGVEAKLATDDWEVEGAAILSDAAVCDLVYIRRVANTNDVTLFPPMFVQALSIKLASAMCLEITNSQEKKVSLLQEFQGLTQEAGWLDAVQSRARVIQPWEGSRTIASRLGGFP